MLLSAGVQGGNIGIISEVKTHYQHIPSGKPVVSSSKRAVLAVSLASSRRWTAGGESSLQEYSAEMTLREDFTTRYR